MTDALLESVLLLVVGMGVVLISLTLLAWMIGGIKFVDEKLNLRRIRTYAERVAPTLPEDDVSDEVAAVIAAAVATTFRKKAVVRRIRVFSPGGAWSSTGRINIMASHHFGKRRT